MSSENQERVLKWSTIVATAGTAVLAITALITVTLTINAWKVERESSRPYLALKESPSITEQQGLLMEFKFNNVGVHPVADLISRTLIVQSNLEQQPIHFDEYHLVNEMPKDMPSSMIVLLEEKELPLGQRGIPPHFVVVNLGYTDPVLRHQYRQTLYYKWNGIIAGKIQPLVHVELREKERILDYFKENGLEGKMGVAAKT